MLYDKRSSNCLFVKCGWVSDVISYQFGNKQIKYRKTSLNLVINENICVKT